MTTKQDMERLFPTKRQEEEIITLNIKYNHTLLYRPMACSFFQGNVIKYVVRYKDKNGIEDLKKLFITVN